MSSSTAVRSFIKSLVAIAGIAAAFVLYGQTQPASTTPAAPAATETQMTPAPVDADGKIDGGDPVYLKPETVQQRQDRLGTTEDPGANPDPQKHYWRYGRSVHIERYRRKFANSDGSEFGWTRPFGFVNFQAEVYQQNEKYVWVWMPDRTPDELEAAPVAETPKGSVHQYSDVETAYLKKMRPEFAAIEPMESTTTIRFEKSSSGLPTTGSWRNSLAIADMNGDGIPDIVAPPERKGTNHPVIFLGDGKGGWKHWATNFPRTVDYGTAVTADFNRDGKMDVAFGIHLQGVAAFLGDGKGKFTDVSNGLPKRDFPTRRIAVADVNGDGYPDIVGISEGPAAIADTGTRPTQRGIVVWVNHDKGTRWVPVVIADETNRVGGDWLTLAHLNSDRSIDVVGSSIFFNSNQIVYLSDGNLKWKSLNADGYLLPSMSYYLASAAGKFSQKKVDDVLISYLRFWPNDVPPSQVAPPESTNVAGIDRLSFTGSVAKRTPVVRWAGGKWITGVAGGDFNGDGRLDVIYTRFDPREAVILLGDGKGEFSRAKVEGLTLQPNTNYDVKIADVNGDGKPDVIVMYESSGATAFASRNGSIEVFLNRGAETGLTASTNAK